MQNNQNEKKTLTAKIEEQNATIKKQTMLQLIPESKNEYILKFINPIIL